MTKFLIGVAVGALAVYGYAIFLSSTPATTTSGAGSVDYSWHL